VEPGRERGAHAGATGGSEARVVKLNPQRGTAGGRQFVSAKAVERTGVTSNGTAWRRAARRARSIRPSAMTDSLCTSFSSIWKH
jgi:hypothetical protein